MYGDGEGKGLRLRTGMSAIAQICRSVCSSTTLDKFYPRFMHVLYIFHSLFNLIYSYVFLSPIRCLGLLGLESMKQDFQK